MAELWLYSVWILLIAIPYCSAQTCPTSWQLFNQYCYSVSTTPIDEPDAETGCRGASTPSVLTSIHSTAENAFIQQLMTSNSVTSIWLGGKYDGTNWRWLDQTTFDFTNWAAGQPTNQRCLLLSSSNNYNWASSDCFSVSASYICKVATPINCANSNPCLNGGTCVTTSGTGSCTCLTSFTGPLCGTLASCTPNPCLNGGVCQTVSNVPTCTCAQGFSGTICATSAACNPNPCQNGGQCVAVTNGFQCVCQNGFSGTNCQILPTTTLAVINNCNSSPCTNGGTCTNFPNSFSCACLPGFTGTTCNIVINNCASIPCQNNGICSNGINRYTCTCVNGFTGTNCQTSSNPCASSPCFNNGTCAATTSGFQCFCPPVFTGIVCQSLVNFCSSSPCQNGGICQSSTTGYTCTCLGQFTGTNCQFSPSGTNCASSPCSNGATCINTPNSFFCRCASGFFGLQCTQSTGVCSSNPCLNGGSCIDLNNAYTCQCPTGFSGITCQFTNTNICLTNSPCLDAGVCSYSLGVTICTCSSNFQGPVCGQIGSNQCSSFPCQNGGTCLSGINYYYCLCPANFFGINCQFSTSSGACTSSPCQNNGSCSNMLNGFTCACTTGWTGTVCNIPTSTMCNPSPCQNGGQCVAVSSVNYVCNCLSGWTGTICNQQIATGCASSPCLNGGTCSTTSTGYSCACLSGYSGTTCSFVLCQNGWRYNGGYCYTVIPGSMSQSMGQQSCSSNSAQLVSIHDSNEENFVVSLMTASNVATAWIGAQYSTSTAAWSWVDQSAWDYTSWGSGQPSSPASLTCALQSVQNSVGSWQTSSCSSVDAAVCKNMGRIAASGTSFPCFSNPCQNSGTCSTVSGSYVCTCPAGFGGTNCQLSVSACQSNPCFNGGTCKVVGTGYVCSCPSGFTVASSCNLPCPSGWTWFLGKCYFPVNNAVSYNAAVNACPSQQALSRLIFIENINEFYFIATLANQLSSNLWLGMSYNTVAATYVWTNGAYLGPNDYQAWGFQQPASPSSLPCVEIVGIQGYTWSTTDCTQTLKYICKWDGST